jgi:hypothetical protein
MYLFIHYEPAFLILVLVPVDLYPPLYFGDIFGTKYSSGFK